MPMPMRPRRPVPQSFRGIPIGRSHNYCNCFRITSLAGPHPLNPIESHPCKNTGEGTLVSPPFTDHEATASSPFPHRAQTRAVSSLECALASKHRVLPDFGRNWRPASPLECAVTRFDPRKSFRMRTYRKKGGGAAARLAAQSSLELAI